MATLPVGDPLPAPELHPAAVAVLSLAGVDATPEDQQALCYRAIEKLRLWHNEQGDRTRLKPADPQFLKLAEFREWVRKEWEPRHKAAYLALHSTAGFDQKAPEDFHSTDPVKQAAALAIMDAKQAIVVAAGQSKTFDSAIGAVDKFPSLAAAEAVEDPLEDYTTYTEVDPNSHITITSASKINWADLQRNDAAYVYKDKGAGHFSANFTHLFETMITALVNLALPFVWAVANGIGCISGGQADEPSGQSLSIMWRYVSSTNLYVTIFEHYASAWYSGSTAQDALLYSVLYYEKTNRDEAVGTYGTQYYYAYSDAARTTLVASASLALHAKIDYQYHYALSAYASNTPLCASTGYNQNLDLGEQSVVPLAMHYYATRRGR